MSYVIDTVLPFCLYVALLSACMPATDRVQAALAGDQTPEEVFSYDLSGVPIIFAPEKRSSDLDMKTTQFRDYDIRPLSIGMTRRGNSGAIDGRMFHFQLPSNERIDDPDCFVEIRVPRKVGGKCKKLPSGTPYCSARGYHYFNHKDCRSVDL
ncbi:hypothetical protein LSH36_26g00020 [Paralvinella palmiformis]|uniref:Lipoprotein n=1 Tax=Paralvinella palmiformis TaxID=53620 RepID=A0AAD9KAH2_9ANNE|nr:hypothetical protein LSH36_26g00020 [Paralvinella palmiformis]